MRSPAVTALQGALAAEHAACWGYAVAGAHLSGSWQDAARQDWAAHAMARDALAGMIAARGQAPAAAQAFYRLPFPVRDAASAKALAALLEDGVTRAYLGVVAVADLALRAFGAMAMQGPAQRAAFWRGSTEAFPGMA
ncbi:MAG: ferritin-like domain-containing protein [Streptosporangiaceae bacterium]|nr:ferritin-like domain-containing protein [Streptosporangiaceae bacterium]